jgi:hypothetical protein
MKHGNRQLVRAPHQVAGFGVQRQRAGGGRFGR